MKIGTFFGIHFMSIEICVICVILGSFKFVLVTKMLIFVAGIWLVRGRETLHWS